ncbi:MAG: DUF2057 family protein [Gammaproteobacteria bacterium]|nr:DUF2057 family protein [Gammaproteobacteria bacterium]
MTLKTQHILLLFSLIWIQSCSTVSGPVHFYSGQPRHNSETARLHIPGPITVKKIDGKKVDVPSIDDGFYEIYLLPGIHRIDFKYELYWGDNISGMLMESDVVGVETRFFAGMNYELTYPVPNDEEEADEMTSQFKAKLLEKKTGRQVASRSTAELDEFRIKTPIKYSSGNATQPKVNHAPITKSIGGVMVPTDITADTAVREDTVKRMKFWWLMANEEERKRFKEWMKSAEGVE